VEVTKAAGGVSMTSPMGFAEALSDDGSLAAASPGESATAYFLISEFQSAVIAAVLVVVIELGVTSWVRHRDLAPARGEEC
jgi:hypothetical protein